MMNLLIAESSRLWARRMTRFFPLGVAVLFVVGVVIAYFVITNGDNDIDFVDDVAGGIEALELLGPVTTLMPIMAFVIGASSIGADAKTGMLEQILTWEPRRLRLLAARLASTIVGVGILAIALAVFLIVLLFALSAVVGTTGGTTGEFWGNVAVIVFRTGVAAGLFAAFGVGITLLINNSIGSIVGFIIYWFVIENIIISAFLPRIGVFMPIANADAFASGRDVERIDGSVFSDDFDFIQSHSYLVAGLILLLWVLAAVVGGAIMFARRDID